MPEVTQSVSKVDEEKNNHEEKVQSTNTTNGTSENGVSSTSPEKSSPEKSEAEVLLAQGKRHLFIKDYPNAVATLGDACAKLDEMYGYLADECADAYFCYGRALLELAREDSNVLGTDPEKEGSEEGDEEDEDEEEENKSNQEGNADENVSVNEAETKNDNEDQEKDSVGDESVDTTKEVNDEEEDKDAVDNLQLAWEVFELAKKIFERQNAKDRLADTFLYLGEVQMESENYNGAIADLKQCIEVQNEILPPDHREIAETYFQLGVACSLSNEFDSAIEYFKTSCEILENRIKNLEKNGPPKEETEKNPFYTVEKEVSELKALLPEIKAKVADMEDFKQETINRVMATFNMQPQSNDGAGPSSSSAPAAPAPSTNGNESKSKPVNDISHLVRKKRKPEEESASETSVKKSCTDEVKK